MRARRLKRGPSIRHEPTNLGATSETVVHPVFPSDYPIFAKKRELLVSEKVGKSTKEPFGAKRAPDADRASGARMGVASVRRLENEIFRGEREVQVLSCPSSEARSRWVGKT